MPAAALPTNEMDRLATLRAYGILDTPADARFDTFTRLAARLFDAPIALVTLIDEARQWIKSAVGLGMREMPRDVAFCAHAILHPEEMLVVEDAARDPRFADNPLVLGDPHIRFYAGAPLRVADGHALGALCVIDHRPRRIDPAALKPLADLAEGVVTALDLHRSKVGPGRTGHDALDRDVRRALAQGEFVLHWQDRIGAGDGRVRCREALLRWNRPEGGLMMPGHFLLAAEASGIILEIDRWVLARTCRETAARRDSTSASVNVSAAWFGRDGLVEAVAAALAESGLDPARLEIEVTEHVLMDRRERAKRIFQGLKALGVRLALDDFGTRYASLAYLADFPFDTIKLDRGFVESLCGNPRALTVARAVRQLGRGLDMAVCAEGVETRWQLDTLRAEGFDEVQGFLIGRPVPG